MIEAPRDAVAICWLANIERDSGNLAEAIRLLRDVDIDTPNHGIPAAGLLATWLIEAGAFEDALSQLRSILARLPGEALVHRQMAQVLNLMGRRQEAAAHVRELCAMGNVTQNELASLLSLRLPFDTRESNFIAADVDQGDGVLWPSALAQARELIKRGEAKAAMAMMQDSVRKMARAGSTDPWMLSLFGRTAFELNDDRAIALWLASVSPQVTQSADHWCALGLLAGRPDIGHINEATQFCQAALRLDPTDWSTCGYLEGLSIQAGNPNDANEYRERALWIQGSVLAANRLATSEDSASASETMQSLIDALRSLDRDQEAAMWAIIRAQQAQDAESKRSELAALASDFRRLRKQHSRNGTQAYADQVQGDLIASADVFLIDMRARFPNNSGPIQSVELLDDSRTADDELDTAVHWRSHADNRGISFQYANAATLKEREFQLYEQFGAGVAAFDYDRDGHVDLYFPQAAGTPNQSAGNKPNSLFRQIDRRFANLTQAADCDDRGYGLGIAVGDLNQDGWEDLLICNFGLNVLLINQGDGTFRRQTPRPSEDSYWTSSIAVADFDRDSLPDIFEGNYVSDPTVFDVPSRNANGRLSVFKGPESYKSANDRVLFTTRDGARRSTELVTDEAPSPALGVVAGDFDEDSQVDVYVANDMRGNHYWSYANEEFAESGQLRGCAFGRQGGAGASMGIATGDFDGNEHIDFHVTNFLNEPVHHFLQTDSGLFLDGVVGANLSAHTMPVLGFGAAAADIDNDCDDDLIVLNGHIDDLQFKGADFKMLPQCFVNSKGGFRMRLGDDVGEFFSRKTLGRGLSILDWDRDGRLDFVANHLDCPAELVENVTETPYSWLQIRLVGTSCERSCVGASVRVQAGNRTVKKWQVSGSGYSSHDESILHFGLGDHRGSISLLVNWPDGSMQRFGQLPTQDRLLIVQGKDDIWTFENR